MSKNKYISILLTCLFFNVSFQLKAQQLPFANLSITDGLEDMVVFDIEQDDQGFLWMTTRTGINRYDGNQFWTYNRSNGLPHNLVRDLMKAKNGKLWAASEAGLAWFDGENFQAIDRKIWPESVSARIVKEAPDGSIWVATYGMGLLQFDASDDPKIIKQFNHSNGFPSDRIRSLLIDDAGQIWAGDSNQIIRIIGDEFKVMDWQADPSEIRAIFQNIDQQIWVGTRQGIAILKEDSFVPLTFDVDISDQSINSISLDSQNQIWISSRDFGAYLFDQNRKLIQHIKMDDGLPDNSVNSIFVDEENNTWFGTYGGGISRLSEANVINWKAQAAMPNPNVYAIVQDSNYCIWIGTNGDGVSKLCDGSLTHITTDDGLSHNKILTAAIDNDDGIWFGTLHGITLFKDQQYHHINEESGLTGSVVYHILKANDGSLWIATNNGLNHLKDGKITAYFTQDGLPDNRINRIFQSKNNDIWLASSNGLSLFKDGQFTNWSSQDGLAANFINDIYEDDQGTMWLATNDGLSLFDGKSFTTWTTQNGLPHNNATTILPGNEGEIWIGTSRGVAIFDGKNFTIITSREGLVFDLVNRGAGFRDPAGNLWFGTAEGISKFDADFKPGSSSPPPVHLLHVRNELGLMALNQPIKIPQKNSNLLFNFTAISFQRAPDITYRYRLAVDESTAWRETRLNEIQFNSLATGHYQFQVTARIGNGEWNAYPALIDIEVTPPFWQTPWSILLILVSFLSVLFYRNWRNRQHATHLEKIVQERTKQLKEVNSGLDWLANHDNLTRLANRHYVHNLLNSFKTIKQILPFGVISIDLDYFKSLNDEHGHDFGDQALKIFSTMLLSHLNENQTAARWGGEEFIVICPKISCEKITEIVQNILVHCQNLQLLTESNHPAQLRCSIGFVFIPQLVNSQNLTKQLEQAIQLADKALYTAKHKGRDQICGLIIKQSAEDVSLSKYLLDIQYAIEKSWIEVVKH